jgi:hypothetical protein
MSTLWTPEGEHPVSRQSEPAPAPARGPAPEGAEPTEEELVAEMAELREQLVRTPAEVVVVNHAYGLAQLARLHLSLDPPQLDQARVAIDAFAALVEGMRGRLGEPEPELVTFLDQLRLAFVEIARATARS